MMTKLKIYRYCVDKRYCTSATTWQYNEILDYAEENPEAYEDIAVMIWLTTPEETLPISLELFKQNFKLSMK